MFNFWNCDHQSLKISFINFWKFHSSFLIIKNDFYSSSFWSNILLLIFMFFSNLFFLQFQSFLFFFFSLSTRFFYFFFNCILFFISLFFFLIFFFLISFSFVCILICFLIWVFFFFFFIISSLCRVFFFIFSVWTEVNTLSKAMKYLTMFFLMIFSFCLFTLILNKNLFVFWKRCLFAYNVDTVFFVLLLRSS